MKLQMTNWELKEASRHGFEIGGVRFASLDDFKNRFQFYMEDDETSELMQRFFKAEFDELNDKLDDILNKFRFVNTLISIIEDDYDRDFYEKCCVQMDFREEFEDLEEITDKR